MLTYRVRVLPFTIGVSFWIACLVPGVSASAAPASKPNIIIVMPDDIGYGDFSCLGNPIIHTPNIDAFQKQSVRFTNFHVSPTCAPTRAALLTGRHEFKSGVTHTIAERERLSLKATTFAQVLKADGYATGIFGKWHLGDEQAYQPERRGFDETFVHGAGGIGQSYPGSCGDAPGNTYFSPAIRHNGVFEKTDGYCTDVFFNQALTWIDAKRKADAPFFAFITPNAAHTPLQCPADYAKRHAGEVPENVARFYGMIENIDDNFGRLTAALKQWGLERDTLVIFMTDNGGTIGVPIFNAGMRGAKVTPYEGGIRVPAFWRWPAAIEGDRDVSALTAHVDVFPTIAEVVGADLSPEASRQVEGRSLVPFFKDQKVGWPNRTLVAHVGRWERGKVESFKYVGASIRDDRYALVNNTELYDLQTDPGQKTDVAAAHPDVLARLRQAYKAWWLDVLPRLENEDAVGPKVNPYKEWYEKQFGEGATAAPKG
ncbi:MAG: arylsulfatase [Paludisphaera borealis]|uniref:arylsulfatase n=1 Tax=Paludisphaera borealis TaxID=1387353 RepID=UPI002840B04C|nr:arylsulfatase [Paludisphaera borealis]MDR3623272.1 arylsulfatase [Paludisphaera borealis]